jgi:cobalamin transport system substrate-binding protein
MLVVALAMLLCSAGAPSPEVKKHLEAPPTITPQFLGAALDRRAERIVTVAPSVTEILFALGAGDRVVGVSRYDDHPPEVKSLARVGGFLDPNAESIVALKPDLVVGVPNAGNRPVLERIAKLGIAVYVVPGNSLADVFWAMRALGALLGGEAKPRAEALEKKMKNEIDLLAGSLAKDSTPKVAFVYGRSPLVLAGPDSFADGLLAILNAKNIAATGPAYPQYSIERLVLDRPDVILDASEAHDEGSAPWLKFPTIPAVKNHRVHALPLGDVLRPGPRIVEGMRRVATLLHPDQQN